MDIVLIALVCVLIVLNIITILVLAKQKQNSNLEKEFRSVKEDLTLGLKATREEINVVLGNRIDGFSRANEEKLEAIRTAVEDKLGTIQKENTEKLEQMRQTVDEKLHDTLEKRLGESFKLVNDRLESVYKGLGEMQNLAVGVGDLKKVLSDVKTRGTWGEIRLGNILEQYLTPDQYERNVKLKPRTKDFVEFAIKIPSKVGNSFVMLPVDSKYPVEDYNRLLEAEEKGNKEEVAAARKALAASIKRSAGEIRDKYINPPLTTDFGVMFLPIESLFCEVLKNTSLCETLQRDYKVTVAGPTTLTAFINSLQLGFHALAIEKQTSEVWKILTTVKVEFNKFGDILAKTNKKLQEVANTMKDAESKTRNIQTKLGKVDTLAFSQTEVPVLDSIQSAKENEEEIEVESDSDNE